MHGIEKNSLQWITAINIVAVVRSGRVSVFAKKAVIDLLAL
jgi:hypothetical protein